MVLQNLKSNRDVLEEVEILEQHVHNHERWFGKSADQTGNNWGTKATLTPYRAISGLGVFGADANDEALVLGSADTPAVAGASTYDLHRILVIDQDDTSVYVIRVIWGTGTMADAEAAEQYADVMAITDITLNNLAGGGPVDLIMTRVNVGTKVWIRIKNATNNVYLDFFVGLHEYI